MDADKIVKNSQKNTRGRPSKKQNKNPWVVKPEQKSPRVGKYQSFYFCS